MLRILFLINSNSTSKEKQSTGGREMAWPAPAEDRRRLAGGGSIAPILLGKEESAAACDFRWQNLTNGLK